MTDPAIDPTEVLLRQRAKGLLRGRMRSVRRLLAQAACEERSRDLCAQLLKLPELQAARCVLGYAAFRREPSVAIALEALAARGATVGLPRVVEHELSLHHHQPGQQLQESALGILEPAEDTALIAHDRIDVVLVPGVCFDARGYRIGYGKGYYDRLLPRLPKALRIGICYDHELLGELPEEPHDATMHRVVTNLRVFEVKR